MKYFAYGSNLSHEQMAERCPSSKFLERAYIEDYRLIFDGESHIWGCAVCNIDKSAGDVVWGGIYDIGEKAIKVLDVYEKHYDKIRMKVTDEEGNDYKVGTYLRTGQPRGEPSDKYLNVVIQGARDCGLPEEYIENKIKTPAKVM